MTRKTVIAFDPGTASVSEAEPIEKVEGKLKSDPTEDKLLKSVLENDREEIDKGRIITETINQGITSFNPDMMFKSMVTNYKMAEKTYGETLIRQFSGYDPGYVKKNVNIPEFRERLKSNIQGKMSEMEEDGLIDKKGNVTGEALRLCSIIMYMEELDRLRLQGLGRKKQRKKDNYGTKDDVKDYKEAKYRDLAMKQSVNLALRREHTKIQPQDLKAYDRRKKGKMSIIYAMDASGSMKGDKIGTAKKAGIALAYHAIQERDEVGLIVFGSGIKTEIRPSQNFERLLQGLAKSRAGRETNISGTIKKAIEMFPKKNTGKHLMLLTDALPTRGEEPVSETIEAASMAHDRGITISVLGINLDEQGEKLARKVVEIGKGKLYKVSNVDEMDTLVLEDYFTFSQG